MCSYHGVSLSPCQGSSALTCSNLLQALEDGMLLGTCLFLLSPWVFTHPVFLPSCSQILLLWHLNLPRSVILCNKLSLTEIISWSSLPTSSLCHWCSITSIQQHYKVTVDIKCDWSLLRHICFLKSWSLILIDFSSCHLPKVPCLIPALSESVIVHFIWWQPLHFLPWYSF